MNKANQKTAQRAYALWYGKCHQSLEFALLDEAVAPFLDQRIDPATGEWLRKARKALLVFMGEAARRAGVRRSTWDKLEKSETAGTIQLNTLRKMAAIARAKMEEAHFRKNQRWSERRF